MTVIKYSDAKYRAHKENIRRYEALLKTELTVLERRFIGRRLLEEQQALSALTRLSLPVLTSSKADRPASFAQAFDHQGHLALPFPSADAERRQDLRGRPKRQSS